MKTYRLVLRIVGLVVYAVAAAFVIYGMVAPLYSYHMADSTHEFTFNSAFGGVSSLALFALLAFVPPVLSGFSSVKALKPIGLALEGCFLVVTATKLADCVGEMNSLAIGSSEVDTYVINASFFLLVVGLGLFSLICLAGFIELFFELGKKEKKA
ncbi:MAG: hypothetical protein LKG11_02995 [Bacilli bacterium]|jgi:hypothetical protein|nr:hypothetical protein [Bacilli bacterium]